MPKKNRESKSRYTVAPVRRLSDISLPGTTVSGRVNVPTKLTHEQFATLKRTVEAGLVYTAGEGMAVFKIKRPKTRRTKDQIAKDEHRHKLHFERDPLRVLAESKQRQLEREQKAARIAERNRNRAGVLVKEGLVEPTIHHTGGGWYDIRVGGTNVDRIRGKDAAETALQALKDKLDADAEPPGEDPDAAEALASDEESPATDAADENDGDEGDA